MPKKDTDKKLNRVSTIIEIATNLGTIVSWLLGIVSAYALNIQKFPVVIPGINFTLDIGFQFSLVVSAVLAYIHFLMSHWNKHKGSKGFSDGFFEFVFWDLPNLKQPLLLIPFVFTIAICIQLSLNSILVAIISILFLGAIIFILYFVFSYHFSPERRYEKLPGVWEQDDNLKSRWEERIRRELIEHQWRVRTSNFYDSGFIKGEEDKLQIEWALRKYFEKFELEQFLILEYNTIFYEWELRFNPTLHEKMKGSYKE